MGYWCCCFLVRLHVPSCCVDAVSVLVFIGKCWRCCSSLFARLCCNLSCFCWWGLACVLLLLVTVINMCQWLLMVCFWCCCSFVVFMWLSCLQLSVGVVVHVYRYLYVHVFALVCDCSLCVPLGGFWCCSSSLVFVCWWVWVLPFLFTCRLFSLNKLCCCRWLVLVCVLHMFFLVLLPFQGLLLLVVFWCCSSWCVCMFRVFCFDVVFVFVSIGRCWRRCSVLFARLCSSLSCLCWWVWVCAAAAENCYKHVLMVVVGVLLVLLFVCCLLDCVLFARCVRGVCK